MTDRRSIFITGGAGGMGLETGRYFSEKGWLVGLFDSNTELLNQISDEFNPEQLVTGRLDVTQQADFEPAIAEFAERSGGRMDILFNNAGIAPGGWFDEMELSVRSFNCLQAAGIKYIHELVSKEENQMLKYKNFGRKSLTELVEKLSSMGLNFGMDTTKIMAEEG